MRCPSASSAAAGAGAEASRRSFIYTSVEKIDNEYPATPAFEKEEDIPPCRTTNDMKNRAQSFKTAVIDVVVTLQVLRKLNDAKFKQIAKKTLPARSGKSGTGEERRTEKTCLASVRATGPVRNRKLKVDDTKRSPRVPTPSTHMLLLRSIFLRRIPRVASRIRPANSSAAVPVADVVVSRITDVAERHTPAEMPLTATAILVENLSSLATHEKAYTRAGEELLTVRIIGIGKEINA